MGRPRQDPNRPATTDRILDAAEGAFAAHGLSAPLADIARGAGIRRPSLLYHFATKEDLYAAVVTRTFSALGAALTAAMAHPGAFAARLEAVTRTFATFLQDNPNHARILIRELLAEGGPGTEILSRQVAPLLDAVVRWIEAEGAGRVPLDLPVRHAVLQVASTVLLSTGSGPLARVLWGEPSADRHWAVARALFLPAEVTS